MKDVWMVLVIVMVAVVLAVAGWFAHYHANLRPRLVLELPVSACSDIDFGTRGYWRWGSNVSDHCTRAGLKLDRPVFAIRGKRVVRIVPDTFHAVYGQVETVPADPNTVYFYTYHPRYKAATITAP
jgi:hypothetical protein